MVYSIILGHCVEYYNHHRKFGQVKYQTTFNRTQFISLRDHTTSTMRVQIKNVFNVLALILSDCSETHL